MRERSRSASVTSERSRSLIDAMAPDQKILPTTAASASIDLASGASVSRRAADQGQHRVGEGDFCSFSKLPTQALLNNQVLVPQETDELLGVERIPLGSFEDRLLKLGRDHGGFEQRGNEACGLFFGERRQVDVSGVPKSGSVVRVVAEQLGAGCGNHEQRNAFRTIGQILQEGEHRFVGPVEDPSKTRTVGPPSAICSRNLRQAVKSSARSAEELASIPRSGSRRWRNHSRSEPSGRTASSLAFAESGSSDSKIPA